MTISYDSAFSARCILHTSFTFNYFCAIAECNIVLLELKNLTTLNASRETPRPATRRGRSRSREGRRGTAEARWLISGPARGPSRLPIST